VEPPVFDEMSRSFDEGVAEFLNLARVKQNTLGNTRMLKNLHVS
jgi:amino-acid N-acetyltransferase